MWVLKPNGGRIIKVLPNSSKVDISYFQVILLFLVVWIIRALGKKKNKVSPL